jgi:hypothetical protein
VTVVKPEPEILESPPSPPLEPLTPADPLPPTVIVYCVPGLNSKAVSEELPPPEVSLLKEVR